MMPDTEDIRIPPLRAEIKTGTIRCFAAHRDDHIFENAKDSCQRIGRGHPPPFCRVHRMQVISGCLRLWHFPLLMIIRPVLRIETYSETANLLDLSARFRHAKVAALARNRIAQSAGSFCQMARGQSAFHVYDQPPHAVLVVDSAGDFRCVEWRMNSHGLPPIN